MRMNEIVCIEIEINKVYINLFDQKEPSLDFNDDSEKIQKFENIKNKEYFKGVILPSTEEQKQHKDFVKNFIKKK